MASIRDDLCIKSLMQSSYYSKLFDGYNVVFIYVTGSRLTGCTDDHSDYDLIVVADNDFNEQHPNEFLIWRGKKVHWYFRPMSKFIKTPENVSPQQYIGLMEFALFSDDCVIYENPAYKAYMDKLRAMKNQISVIGSMQLYNRLSDMVNTIIEKRAIPVELRSKYIGHLVLESFILLGEEIDTVSVCRIKRMRWQGLTEADEQFAVYRLRLLKAFIEQNPVDVKQMIANVDMYLTNA